MNEAGQLPPGHFPIELHCHSTASDGTYPPARVAEMAAAGGVRVLALTDHDTTAGIAEAAAVAARHGMTLIPGVELTCSVERGEVHLLGYFVSVSNAAFQAKLTRISHWPGCARPGDCRQTGRTWHSRAVGARQGAGG